MNLDSCWDCPLGLWPAFATAIAAVVLLYAALRLDRARTRAIRLLGCASGGIALFLYAGLTKYVGWHGLAESTGPNPLPSYIRFLFLGTWLAVSALAFRLARTARPRSASTSV